MADTATTRNRLRKLESGQYANAWASPLNGDGGSDRLDDALDGVVSFALSGSKTLTSTNYVADEARMRQIHITSGTGGTVTIPAVEKYYVVRNAASGTVVFTCGGTTASIPASSVSIILCNGTNCYTMSTSTDAAAAAASAAAAAASASSAATAKTNAETAETNAELAETNAETAQAAAEVAQAAAEAAQAAAEAASLPSQTGNSGKYLTTNGSAPSWATIPVSEWTQIGSTQTPSAVASSSITGIAQTYQDLLIEILGLSHDSGSNQTLRVEMSGDNGSSWTSPLAVTSSVAGSATVFGSILLPRYRADGGGGIRQVENLTADVSSASAGGAFAWRIAGGIDALRLSWSAGNFDAGSWKLWGK